jgi:hypothetical protein
MSGDCGEHCLDCLCFSNESKIEADYKEAFSIPQYFGPNGDIEI